MAASPGHNRHIAAPSPSGLADVVDLILDKGLVIDLYVRVSLVGIELLTIDARIVVASVDTYLRFAEAVNRLQLADTGAEQIWNLPRRARQSGASGVVDGIREELLGDSGGEERRGRRHVHGRSKARSG